jgi:hypothetical protein
MFLYAKLLENYGSEMPPWGGARAATKAPRAPCESGRPRAADGGWRGGRAAAKGTKIEGLKIEGLINKKLRFIPFM